MSSQNINFQANENGGISYIGINDAYVELFDCPRPGRHFQFV